MSTESSTTTTACAKCGQTIEYVQSWTPGGLNDYGGFIIRCTGCETVDDIYVGRDIGMSHVTKGARELDSYDRDVEGSRARKREKHGLPPA